MKYFLKRILSFLLIPFLFLLIISIAALVFLPKSEYYKIDPAIKNLYVGDSHIQYAIVDSLLVESQNIAVEAETFYFSYFRLKKILESENNIEKVYLGLGYHSLSSINDDFVYGKSSFSTAPKYFYLLPFSEQKKVLYSNYKSNHLHNYFKILIKSSFRPLVNNSKFGGYSNYFYSTASKKRIMDKRINYHFYKDKLVNGYSNLNLFYLEEIINLSKKYKFDLVIINTPLDPYYKEKIPKKFINKYDEIINKFNLKLIDFYNLRFDESCFIPDGDHLSVNGAIKMTKELIK
ncbi:hypothetical protein [Algibacter pectinivorans]|uniref:Uncharacterized protein n=1 Tax=Algibacter pectinivorans TaxID=870482 RepID=A0A1I1PLA4_9FLAO|nr:hypothetical protein [Algibacter pectinivorans]SFD07753.1 hypothetical protein SAMN04487987_103400 [Algibacter pectinivorans]